jgi:uncharacterized membrane protein
MWLIGLLLGLVVGGLLHGVEGAIIGAAAGAVLAIMQRMASLRTSARLDSLESTMEALREQVRHLRQGGVASTQQTTAAPAVRYQTPEVATPVRVETPQAPTTAAPERETAATYAPVIASEAEQPSYWDRLWVWLTGGNTLVRVGVIVLFFGVAFLMKYAYEHTQVPIELRLIGVTLGAIALLVVGWRLRDSRPGYSQALQGGAIGLLYLTVFGAFRMFHLLPGGAAFFLLIAIAIFSALLAIVQNAQSLVIVGIAGGFLAPVLASSGGGSHVMLFSYYLVLNLGILAIALYKSWRALNVLGLVFTFGIGSIWGARYYDPQFFASTEPFLVIFFLLYVAIAVLYALREAPRFKHYVDSTIVFGTPLVAFGLQTQLVRDIEYGAAWSALAVAAMYIGLAGALYRRHQDSLRMLVEAFLALGVIFATLTIPLALDGRWTAAAWALEGAAAYWVGTRQARRLPRAFGLLMQFGAGVELLGDARHGIVEQALFNSFFLGCVFISGAAFFCNRVIERHAERVGHTAMQVSIGLFLWGLAWWVLGGLHEIAVHVASANVQNAALLFFTGTSAAFSFGWKRGWWIARFPALALTPLMAVILFLQAMERMNAHPFAGLGVIAWPLAFAFHLLILHQHDETETRYKSWMHSVGLWLIAAIAARELAYQVNELVAGQYVWPLVAWAVAPAALLALIAAKRSHWPVARHLSAYLWRGGLPLLFALTVWTLYANVIGDGDPSPLPYVPLLNPLDILQMLVFVISIYWWKAVVASRIEDRKDLPSTWPVTALCVAIFYWANAVLLRTLHHYAGVEYQFPAIFQSNLVQMSLSIFWAALALGTMFLATKRRIRQMWIVGSLLMAVVVLKLFAIDLFNVGTLERIVSFIAVAVLLLVIGYVAPVPPKDAEAS